MGIKNSSAADRKVASKKFSEYMNSLSIRDHEFMVNAIAEKCFVPRSTIYCWKSGRTGIQRVYQVIIEDVAGTKIFD